MHRFPKMIELVRNFPDQSIVSVGELVARVLKESELKNILVPGNRVAVTAGSRGIKNIVLILKTIVDYISSCGCQPFVISAMGSHGGGTVEGQLSLLGKLGITPDNIGAPVLASDRCVFLPGSQDSIYVNALALDFDQIIVVNRVKPHTSFHGPAESGLQKMLAVGLGGPKGASSIHALGVNALSSIIPKVSKIMVKLLPVALGIAILEDAYDNTRAIEVLPTDVFAEREEKLLDQAWNSMPLLPFDQLDLLVVDEIGKIYSGTGMDTNVIGRLRISGVAEPEKPMIKRIVALGLAPQSHGNAYGIGLADFTTRKLMDQIDYKATYLNAMTSTFVLRAMTPMILPNDFSAIQAAIESLGQTKAKTLRMVRIKNTLQLDKLLISEVLSNEVKSIKSVCIAGEPRNLFDHNNNLLPF